MKNRDFNNILLDIVKAAAIIIIGYIIIKGIIQSI